MAPRTKSRRRAQRRRASNHGGMARPRANATPTGPVTERPKLPAAQVQQSAPAHRQARRWIWVNSLSLVAFGAFMILLVLQAVFGWQIRNEELTEHGRSAEGFWHYLGTGHFAEATFENWESEFLQMGFYVLLTAFLVQRGSPSPSHWIRRTGPATTQPTPPKRRPFGHADAAQAWIYRNSLSIVLFGFFGSS